MIKVALLECKSGAIAEKSRALRVLLYNVSAREPHNMTLTDFTLHFSCCFTNLLHSHFVSLLNNFTMQEKCY